jgi:8-oxo-dGTP diphosphatase
VAVVAGGKLLLVKRGRAPGRGLWAVPGGKVGYGETMAATARREVKEETGLDIEPGAVVWAGDSFGPGDPPQWHYCLVDFRGEVTGGELRAGDDAAEVRWVDLDEVDRLPLTPTMYGLVEILKADR